MKVVKAMVLFGFLGLGSSVFAGAMGEVCEGQDVRLACVMTSWGLEVHALYLQPGENGIESTQVIQTNSGRLTEGVKAKWQWGFQVGGTLEWGTSTDLVWNWYNYRNANNLSSLNSPAYLGTIIQALNKDMQTVHQLQIDSLQSNKSVQWDQVNLEMGQNIDLSSSIHFRPHADFQIARIANFTTRTIVGSTLERGSFVYGQNWSSSYTGVGARLGSELAFIDESGFGFYAQAASGLLAGPSKSHFYHQDPNLQAANILNTSDLPVVAHFDAQLGTRLQFEIAQGLCSFELAWLWNAYTQAITIYETYDMPRRTDFSIQGLYFGLKWLGTIA